MVKFLLCLLQLIIAPSKGWEAIAQENTATRRLCSEGFYPLIGVVACTMFIRFFYEPEATLPGLLQGAVITFLRYFITYFLASFIFSLFLKPLINGEYNERRCNTFIIYNLSLLALFQLINNCLPVEISIFQFLPFFDIFIIWFGIPYLAVNDSKKVLFLLLSILSIMVPPYIFSPLLNIVLPS